MTDPIPQDIDTWMSGLGRRWRPIAGAGFLGILVLCGITFLLPAAYEARVTLFMARGATMPTNNPLAGAMVAQSATPASMVQGVVTSRRNLEHVAKAVGLPVEDVQGQLSARADLPANQVTITATSGKPQKALEMVREALGHLETLNREVGFSVGSQQASYLEQSIRRREDEREKAIIQKAAFQAQSIAPSDTEKIATATFALTRLNQTRFELGTVRKKIEAMSDSSEKAARNLPSEVMPNVSRLRSRLIEAEQQAELANARFGPQHPEVKRAEEALASLQSEFQAEVERSIRAVRAGISDGMIELQARLAMLQIQESYWTERAEQAPADMVTLIRLEGEIGALDKVLAGLRARRDEARLQAEIDRFRWTVPLAPRVLQDPVNKNYVVNGIVGLVLGLVAGIMLFGRPEPKSP